MRETANIQETNGRSVTVGLPDASSQIAALKSALHSARIRNPGDLPVTARMTVIHDAIGLCDDPSISAEQRLNAKLCVARAVRELRGLRAALPAPRVAVKGGA